MKTLFDMTELRHPDLIWLVRSTAGLIHFSSGDGVGRSRTLCGKELRGGSEIEGRTRDVTCDACLARDGHIDQEAKIESPDFGTLWFPEPARQILSELRGDRSDCVTLRIAADWFEEAGSWMANYLRWTANDFEWSSRGVHPQRWEKDFRVEDRCWARFSRQGWSKATVLSFRRNVYRVEFPTRWNHVGVRKQGERAWWDIQRRGSAERPENGMKPEPRKGYSTTLNVKLARKLASFASARSRDCES